MVFEKEQNNIKKSSHNLVRAHLGRIFFARLFDLILCSVPTLVLAFLNWIRNWETLLINIPISQLVLFFYFVLFPYFFKGSTLGKFVFNLRLKKVDKNKLKLGDIFWREFYFIYIPLIFQLISQIIIGVILFSSPQDSQNSFLLKLINDIGYTFLGIWFMYIPLTIYLQKENISAIDLKMNTRVLFLERNIEFIKKEIKKTHVHLQNDKPGKINLKEVEKIIVEEDE